LFFKTINLQFPKFNDVCLDFLGLSGFVEADGVLRFLLDDEAFLSETRD